jgi:hypothetical protein
VHVCGSNKTVHVTLLSISVGLTRGSNRAPSFVMIHRIGRRDQSDFSYPTSSASKLAVGKISR